VDARVKPGHDVVFYQSIEIKRQNKIRISSDASAGMMEQ